MANRYTVYNPQEYVETYVPLPIQDMKEMLMYKQKGADMTQNALDTSTDPLAKLKVNAGLKIYDRNNNVIDANVGLEKQKNRLMQELDTERAELADALVNKKLTESEYNSKSRAHINKAKQAYSQLAGTEEILSTINKQNDEMAKNSDYAKSRHYGTELLEYNTNWVNDYMKDGVYKPYTPPSISKEFDLGKDVMANANNWKEHTENASSYLQDGYIRDYKSKGITGTRVYDYVNNLWDSKSFGAKADSDLQIKDRLRSQGIALDTKASDIIPGYKGDGTIFDVLNKQAKEDYAKSLGDVLIHQDISTKIRNDSKANQQQRFNREDEQAKAAFEMGLQYVGADPSTSQNDSNLTRITQSVTGSDNFEFRDGKLHYNPIKEGTEYINVFGKNYDAKKAQADGNIEINGVKFAVTSGPSGQLNVMLPNGDSWQGVNYTVKKANANQGLVNDATKISQVAKRLGYTGGDMKGNQDAIGAYMMDVYNLESTSTAFPVGLETWLSKEFGTNVDKEGNILNPAQLSNMTLKTADGEVVKGDDNADIATIKANKLKGARISGFSKSLTNKNIKAGDLEVTGSDGMRYILSTGKQNLKDASSASHKLLQSVNDWVIEGKKDHDYSELENNIRGIMNVSKDAIHVTSQQKADDNLLYTSFIFNNGGKLEKKVLVTDNKGNLVEKDPISLSEAARRMDSAGMAKHLPFYNKDATKRQEKDYSENITEYEESEE